MINNQLDTQNIVLTPEETGRLEGFKRILLNLEGEISIARKHIKALKEETESAIKENKYQEEMLKAGSDRLASTRATSTKLDEDIQEKSALLNHLLGEIRDQSTTQEEKVQELKDREEAVSRKENRLAVWESELSKKTGEFEVEKEEFNEKVAQLRAVTNGL